MHSPMRIVAFALLTCALLLPPPVAAAQGTCLSAPNSSGTIGDIRTVISGNATFASANAGLHDQVRARLQLEVTIEPDGTARADGEIRLHDDAATGGSATTGILAPYVPMLAIAKRIVGVSCADADGDGRAGLVQLEMESRGGDPVPIVLIATQSDIDANGTYPIELRIGTETGTGEARAKLSREWFHSGHASH